LSLGERGQFFTRPSPTDILAVDGLDDGIFALVDVDATRLELAVRSPSGWSRCLWEAESESLTVFEYDALARNSGSGHRLEMTPCRV
jgi:hypothetical protein